MEINIGSSWNDVLSALAAVVSAFATVALALAAIVGGIIAYSQLLAFQKMERIKYTLKQVQAYFRGSTGLPSPLIAFTRLDETPEDPRSAGISPGLELEKYVKRVGILYTVLQNYLDESDDLLERNLIECDLFMSRQHKVIKETVALLRRFATVMSLRYDERLLASIESRVVDYENRHALTI